MKNVRVRLNNGTFIDIQMNSKNIKINFPIIVKSSNGLEFGIIKSISNVKKNNSTYSFVRYATKEDKKKNSKNNIDAQKAFIKCREIIKKYNLPMNLVDSAFTFDRNQLLIRFVSEERVDFRKLAKNLANIYKTRIELRQLGVRDKAKDIGGCGQCGRELCCKKFLSNFNSVSINMAKNQNIALNPNKINGICGRLLCCLKYEDECYKECRKNLPKVGKNVVTTKGSGKVINVNPLNQTYSILTEENSIVECDLNDSTK